MPKAGFYAVRKGRQPGVYTTWDECEGNTKGFTGAIYKKFNTLSDAELFIGIVPMETSHTRAHFAATVEPSPSAATSSTTRKSSAKPYEKSKQKKGKEEDAADMSGATVVYTDGACSNNGKHGARAGVGVWYGPSDPRNISERCPGDQTNNRAELIAIIRCLEEDLDPSHPMVIKTDSKYSISCVRDWLPNWKRNGWKSSSGTAIKNQQVIRHLSNLLNTRPSPVKFEYVKGHAGVVGNEGADKLAVQGTFESTLSERDWINGDDELSGSRASSTNRMIEVEADFPLLTDDEMERMEKEQEFE